MLEEQHTRNCQEYESYVLWVTYNRIYPSIDEFSGVNVAFSSSDSTLLAKFNDWKPAKSHTGKYVEPHSSICQNRSLRHAREL